MSRAFPVLGLVVLALSLGAFAAAAPSAQGCAPDPGWGTNRPDLAQRLVELVNQHRAAKGLSGLAVSAPLTAGAEWKSLHMAGAGYFAHDDPAPVSRSAHQRTVDCGYRGNAWGENIALGYPTPQAALAGWLGSPGHRAQIESPRFSAVGVGVGVRGGRFYWTQSFGDDAGGAPPVVAQPKVGLRSGPATIARQGSRLTARVAFVDVGTGRLATSGRVGCRAEVDGQRLLVVAKAFSAGLARCTWRLPDRAAGLPLTGLVRLQAGRAAASRVFVRVVR